MELTIERIIRGLEAIKVFLDRSEFVGLEEQTKNQCEILDHAMDALQKYQKIEDIYYHQSGEALENSLRWVIEDGNDD